MSRINKYKYPGAKRLMLEAQEMRDNTEDYSAQPLDDNLFEWHFTLRGPPDTAFDGGYYHGRLIFPTEYPMKPPSIILLTPNGRFETNKKICLSISGFHPETWQPSWSVRTALLALIAFMPSKANKAIGSLDVPDSERKRLAIKSRTWRCETCGLIKDLLVHQPSGSSVSKMKIDDKLDGNQTKSKVEIDVKDLNPGQEGSAEDSNGETNFAGQDSSSNSPPCNMKAINRNEFSAPQSSSESDNTMNLATEQRHQPSLDETNSRNQDPAQAQVSEIGSTTSSSEQANLMETRRTYSPLVLKSIFLLLFLLILRRIVMIVQ